MSLGLAPLLRRARASRFALWALEFAIAAALVFALGLWQTRGHLRGEVPGGALPALDGSTLSLAQLRGKPVLLAFWAPWCGVCKAESQNLVWVRRLVGDRAHVVTVASAYENVEEVRAYLRARGADYPVLLAAADWVARFGVTAYPTVYFLGTGGKVQKSAVGSTTTFGLLLGSGSLNRLFFAHNRSIDVPPALSSVCIPRPDYSLTRVDFWGHVLGHRSVVLPARLVDAPTRANPFQAWV